MKTGDTIETLIIKKMILQSVKKTRSYHLEEIINNTQERTKQRRMHFYNKEKSIIFN